MLKNKKLFKNDFSQLNTRKLINEGQHMQPNPGVLNLKLTFRVEYFKIKTRRSTHIQVKKNENY